MGMNGVERRFARQTCPVGRLIAARLAWAAPRAQVIHLRSRAGEQQGWARGRRLEEFPLIKIKHS
jgi:hypothetical protein